MTHKNAVLKGLENMKEYDKHGNGLVYNTGNINYSLDEMIIEIKNNTEIGKKFSQKVYDAIISYFLKFSQNLSESE